MVTKNILLVEDDEKLLVNLADKLRAEGYDVSTALDGDTGWEMARGDTFDLIVLDIMLPGLDGISLCRLIRNVPTSAHVPIIMLTARGMVSDRILGLETGADDYIVKPFDLGEFLSRVRAQIRRPSPYRSLHQVELNSGDLRLDFTGRRLFKDNEEIKLSNKEFDLLTLFMRNQNAVLSRDWILKNIWGEDFVISRTKKEMRTVDVHIRWLREKIEDNPSSPKRISTVRGVGYRFEG